jgi:hypothetical protein
MPQAILGALQVVLTPVLLVFSAKPMPLNNRPPLLASSDKINQPVVHLVGVHLVRRVCH